MRPTEIMDFWFEGDPSERREKWFEKEPEFDQACARFTAAIRDARAGRYDHWAETPKEAVALVILMDQLSRNVFRGSPEAFAADHHAREIAQSAIDAGLDATLGPLERQFLYLPFEHSESMDDQNHAVRLFEGLRHALGDHSVNYALRHRDVIAAFGRFPHRNMVLGRVNTPEEETWLAREDAGF